MRGIFSVGLLLALFASPAGGESLTSDELALVKKAQAHRIGVIESVYGSVVAIYGPARQGGGSGVVFDPAGYALTNHHVVAAAGSHGQAGLADGKLYKWKLIGTDPGGDVAIIKLEGKDKFPYSPLGISDHVHVGDWTMAMGNPFVLAEDQSPTVTLGIVSGVNRYQYGAGRNTLVYGNCIQVDSSINPGNSGGPLYNMRGQVIGINGRGSFKERGRVNVGVGYAISMKQIRNFVPELMATRMCQHGTLDALFSDRKDNDGNLVVMCDTLNLDAPVARLGLQLGDRLVAFEGEKIRDANQFTNLISTLPADWPAELTYEREGQQRTIWVRLTPLPYGQQQQQVPIEPKEEDPKGEEEKKDGDDDGGDGDKPKRIRIGRARPNLGAEGAIRDIELNRSNAKYLLSRAREFSGAAQPGDIEAFEVTDDLLRKDKRIGEVKSLLATDGRFRVTFTEYGVDYAFGFDGEKYWSHLADREPAEIDVATLLAQPLAAQAAALAQCFRNEPLQQLGDVSIDGSDKAQRKPCYRLKIGKDEETLWYAWLQQFDPMGQNHIQLAKTCTDEDGAETAVLYTNWQKTSGVAFPHTRKLATGLEEASVVQLSTVSVKLIEKLGDEALRSPVNAQH